MKTILKNLADAIALVLVFPAFAAYLLARSALGTSKAFPGWSQLFGLLPGLSGAYLRRAFYRLVMPRCLPGSFISFGTVFSHPTAEVGRDVYIGVYCCLGDVI